MDSGMFTHVHAHTQTCLLAHELLVDGGGEVQVQNDGVVHGHPQEDPDELELLGAVERVFRVESSKYRRYAEL